MIILFDYFCNTKGMIRYELTSFGTARYFLRPAGWLLQLISTSRALLHPAAHILQFAHDP
ncbi:hypothetical protein [Paenibacillus alvei]|uniref:Uncharacterized protein n=1 Tax=Paenibacillus alvei TaxID=44250 RepID=A0AAP6ZZ35_PAEAL|nr:hypothetical protein [Paenibacillus alvei]NOJ70797.1 hypothetical protein [Paenibacillus alvei]